MEMCEGFKIGKKYAFAKLKILPPAYIVVSRRIVFHGKIYPFHEITNSNFRNVKLTRTYVVIFSPFPRIHISYDENEGLIPSVAGTRDTLLFSFD